MIGMVGRVEDVRLANPAMMTAEGDLELYLLTTKNTDEAKLSFSASLAAKINSISEKEGQIPEINWTSEDKVATAIENLRAQNLLASVRDVAEGGSGIAAIKVAMEKIAEGGSFDILLADSAAFFAEGGARYILQFKKGAEDVALECVKKLGVSCLPIARVIYDDKKEIRGYFGAVHSRELLDAYDSAQLIGGLS
jgi:phosphoribosylformylglycinamidine (FGAM) synthase-like enzyme